MSVFRELTNRRFRRFAAQNKLPSFNLAVKLRNGFDRVTGKKRNHLKRIARQSLTAKPRLRRWRTRCRAFRPEKQYCAALVTTLSFFLPALQSKFKGDDFLSGRNLS